MRWFVGFVIVLGALFGASGTARAAVVRDGDTFSVDLSEGRICFFNPTELRTDDDCVGLPADRVPQPIDRVRSRPLAVGIVRAPGSVTSPRIFGLVQAYRIETTTTRVVTAENAKELSELIASGHAAGLPAGATLRPPVTRFETVEGVPVVRTTLDVDGLVPTNDDDFVPEHVEIVSLVATDATYVVQWTGTSMNTVGIAHLADSATPTIRLDPKRVVRAKVGSSPARLFTMVTGVFAVAASIFLFLRRSLRDRARSGRRAMSFHAELWPPHDR
jgi:hypothetical protein